MNALHPSYKHHLLNITILLIVFLCCEWIVFPADNFPLNDDWSYAHSVQYLQETGMIDIGYWPAMNLLAHILWGNLFVSIFGFSHVVLRCSTLCLGILTLIFFYKLMFALCKQYRSSLFLTLFLLFNPLWFLMSNSFMTDVPFLFSLVLAIYSLEKVVVQQKRKYILLFSAACVYSILIRQFGLALSVALALLAIILSFTEHKNRKELWLFAIPVAISLVTYIVFEKWVVNHLPPDSAYQLAGKVTKDYHEMISIFSEVFVLRFSIIMLTLGLFLCPFGIIAAIRQLKKSTFRECIIVLLFSTAITWIILLNMTLFPVGNSFYNSGLGAETLYDASVLDLTTHHASSAVFLLFVKVFAVAGAIGLVMTFVSGLLNIAIRLIRKEPVNRLKLFLLFFSVIYFLMLCISRSFFDRYALPLLAISLLLCAGYFNNLKPARYVAGTYLVFMAVFTVAATCDYFNWNRTRWSFIKEVTEAGVKADDINGGFEYVASRFYDRPWWGIWAGDDATFKVSFGPVPNHHQLGYKVYQRYIPCRKDTLFLYAKNQAPHK